MSTSSFTRHAVELLVPSNLRFTGLLLFNLNGLLFIILCNLHFSGLLSILHLLYNMFHKGTPFDGMTQYRRVKRKDWVIPLPAFGEAIEFRQRTRHKLDSRWQEGVYLGVRLESTEKIVGVGADTFVVQSIRRVLEDFHSYLPSGSPHSARLAHVRLPPSEALGSPSRHLPAAVIAIAFALSFINPALENALAISIASLCVQPCLVFGQWPFSSWRVWMSLQ